MTNVWRVPGRRSTKLPGRPLVTFMVLHCCSDWEVNNLSLFVRSPWRGRAFGRLCGRKPDPLPSFSSAHHVAGTVQGPAVSKIKSACPRRLFIHLAWRATENNQTYRHPLQMMTRSGNAVRNVAGCSETEHVTCAGLGPRSSGRVGEARRWGRCAWALGLAWVPVMGKVDQSKQTHRQAKPCHVSATGIGSSVVRGSPGV